MKTFPKKYCTAWLAGFYHKQPNRSERIQLETQLGCPVKVTQSPYWIHRSASTKYLLWRAERQLYATRDSAKKGIEKLSKEKLYRVFATDTNSDGVAR